MKNNSYSFYVYINYVLGVFIIYYSKSVNFKYVLLLLRNFYNNYN